MIIKYKLSEVAGDFGLKSKDISDILAKYSKAPKSNSQALSEDDLNIIFDALSQKNQIESLEMVFAPAAEAAEKRKKDAEERLIRQQKEAEERVIAEQKAKDAAEAKRSAAKKQAAKAPAKARPQTQTVTPAPQAESSAPQAPLIEEERKKQPKVHYVDTRGSSVNLERYDERMETLVPQQAGKYSQQQSKQKLVRQSQKRQQFVGNKRRQEEQEKLRRLEQQALAKKAPLKVLIPDEISVGELASRLKKTAAEVIKQLMKLGVMASVSQTVDFDTASLVAMELGAVPEKEVVVTIEERLFDEREDKEDELVPRAPVVVVMGHVDHGKTSLLDAIRQTNVVSGEAGGITQHIGAYRVQIDGKDITFLDTPGHAAFTSMRARGAQVTDIAILVVAADDGIMPQTIEAINHAKAADVPIIVAVNKMDKEGANPDRIKQQLTEYDLVPEEWGGTTIICPVSAVKKEGIDNLLEMVLLTAEVSELKANPNRLAKGTVIEAKLDKGRGPVATVLIQNGTLKHGDIVIAGTAVGRVRAMTNDRGRKIESAGPSVPVEIVGLSDVPGAGDIFYAVEDERMARTLAERRRFEETAQRTQVTQKVTLENLFSHIEEGSIKDLNIIVKADVQGSAEAVKASLEKLSNEEVRVRVIHSGVGGVNNSDIMLASASGALIVGFNVRPMAGVAEAAQQQGVEIRLYRIIYDCIEEVEQAMRGMLAPKFREVVLGHAEIRQIFKASGVSIAGCYVTDGKMQRNESVRIVRDNIVIHEGALSTLRRFKDDVKEVAQGFECGMSFEKYNDIKEGDIVEAFIMEEVRP
ncbi:MAG: translation initiation factor IF-2 [Clostridia bacterium]|nr:translation initiation factor IF-2 [Clostridia bacterium]